MFVKYALNHQLLQYLFLAGIFAVSTFIYTRQLFQQLSCFVWRLMVFLSLNQCVNLAHSPAQSALFAALGLLIVSLPSLHK